MNINLEKLEEKCKKFEELEKRGTFYDMALNMINKEFEIEAFFLILATWNFATFRYAMKEFDINGFKSIIKKQGNPIFDKLKDKRLETVNFDEIKEDIEKLYKLLSVIKGVKYTGASKIMHLKNPKLFIMWDGYIKKRYGLRKGTADDHITFLKKMQEVFKDIKWKREDKTLAKAIDEYNYVAITLPELENQKNNKANVTLKVY